MTAPDLASFRHQMDALNARLCAVLQERAALALRIGAWKRAHGMPIGDPERERQMVEQVIAAAGPGFEAKALAAIFGQVFAATRELLAQPPRGTT